MNLVQLTSEISVDVSKAEAWKVLAQYTNVGDFNSGLLYSRPVDGYPQTGLGAARFIQLDRFTQAWEKIEEWKEEDTYTYDIYKWKRFPLNKMRVTFGVREKTNGQVFIYQIVNFRLKPGFLTNLMKPKLKSGMRGALLNYKHFAETGQERTPVKKLLKLYGAPMVQ